MIFINSTKNIKYQGMICIIIEGIKVKCIDTYIDALNFFLALIHVSICSGLTIQLQVQ